MKKFRPDRGQVCIGAVWAFLCLLSAILLRAILWGAEPGSIFGHLKYGIAYLLSGGKRTLLELVILCGAVGCAAAAGWKGPKRLFVPGLLLALFFGGNTLIDQSPTGMLQSLVGFPGASPIENILFWLTQVGSWYALILLFCRWMQRSVEKGQNLCKSIRRQMLWALVILLCWLPILILRSPGSIFRDTDAQILQFQGQLPFEASNPLILSFVYGPIFSLGQGLGGDNVGIFLCVLFQLLLTLYAFSFACEEVVTARGSVLSGALLCLFFGIGPNYGSLVAAVLKDSIHAPLYLLFFLYYRRTTVSNEKKDWVWLAVLAALVALTRKGAVYLAVLSLLGLMLVRSDKKKVLTLGTCALLALHFCLNGVLYPILGVEKPMEKENYSFFYPITGYYCAKHPEELTQQEKDIIGAVLDYDTVCTGFSTRGVDTIKSTYHAESKKAVSDYLALHVKWLFRHPVTCLEALVYSRSYYFTPWSVQGERITVSMSPFSEVKEGAESNFSHWLPEDTRKAVEDRLWSLTDAPVVKELFSPGTYTWLCLALLAAAIYGHNRRKKGMLLPLVLLTAGLLLTHLNGAIRYASPLLYCVPVAVGLFRCETK